ncbi:hypothetical protein L1S32_08315 [Methanogenium sp. S4BF]|uniref:hypothetical protein n=1 Tax=Methanogenium sp. S4BF TaxID=1789226 RepID=UPI0024176E21|nr:hypothetical protein [Methanogenium sp. S4BF]WFN33845.1 hypothetical protein L1S32_08315 [Methanogenium sp. S4BF]
MSDSPVGIKGSAMIGTLAHEGYCFILPDRDYVPLVVTKATDKNGPPEILGPVTSFVKNPKAAFPHIRTDEQKWDITDSYQDRDKASIGFTTHDLIAKVLSGMLNISIAATYSGFDSIRISYTNVTSDSIYKTEVLDYLHGGVVTDNQSISRLCRKSDKCFVIYETLKARRFSISFLNRQEAATDNDIRFFLESAGVSGTGDFSAVKDGSIHYSGKEPQTFAFKGVGFHLKKSLFSSAHSVETGDRSKGISHGRKGVRESSETRPVASGKNRTVNVVSLHPERVEIMTDQKMTFSPFRFI